MLIEITYNVTDVYMSTTETPVYVEISFEQPGGNAAVWGSITGTLSNQTDLQNALDAKFDNPTGDNTQYIAGDGSLVAFPITGQAGTLVREVRNSSGATITKGTVVYINGASGNRPTIAKAIATGDATSAQTFGLVQADILNNANGYIVAFGDLDGLDTQAITEGSQLYLSSTVLGGYTTVKQYAPNHLVYIGVVTRSHPNQGRIEVRIQNGYEADEIHDFAVRNPSNNDGIFFNTATSLWENKSIATALGYTPANAATTLTINGVTYDLSTSRTWTISTGISGSGASGQVTYWTGASAVSGSNNLFWDNTNGRLGIGTNVPLRTLNVNGRSLFGSATNPQPLGSTHTVDIVASTTDSPLALIAGSGNLELWKDTTPTRAVAIGMATPGNAISNDLYFSLFNGTSWNTRFVITNSTGNISIGTTSDLGVRLGVVGDTLLRGSGATSATTALTVQNSDGTQLIRMQNQLLSGSQTGLQIGDGTNAKTTFITLVKGAPTIQTRYLDVITSADILYISGGLGVGNNNLASNHGSITLGDGNYTLTNPTQFNVVTSVTGNFFPTSGSASFIDLLITPTINQTGGANGVSRGLLVRPILTAAADWRSIEWSNNTGWGLYGAGTANNYLAGNLGIGITPTVRLHVSGDTILRGSGATSATTALTVQNSSSTNLFTVRNDGLSTFGNIANNVTHLQIGGASASIGDFSAPAIKFGNTTTGIYTDQSRVFFVSNGIFGGGFAAGYYQGNSAYILASSGANDFNIPKMGGYRLNAAGLSAGIGGNSAGDVSLVANTLARLVAKYTGQTRFVPLASAPLGAEAGDVYYDSTLNKLRVYTTAWETITSI